MHSINSIFRQNHFTPFACPSSSSLAIEIDEYPAFPQQIYRKNYLNQSRAAIAEPKRAVAPLMAHQVLPSIPCAPASSFSSLEHNTAQNNIFTHTAATVYIPFRPSNYPSHQGKDSDNGKSLCIPKKSGAIKSSTRIPGKKSNPKSKR